MSEWVAFKGRYVIEGSLGEPLWPAHPACAFTCFSILMKGPATLLSYSEFLHLDNDLGLRPFSVKLKYKSEGRALGLPSSPCMLCSRMRVHVLSYDAPLLAPAPASNSLCIVLIYSSSILFPQ